MIELEMIKSAVRLPLDSTAQDDYLGHLEETAVDHLQRETGRYFGPPIEDQELLVEGMGIPLLLLPEMVSAVDSIAKRGYLGDTETEIEEDATDGWALRLPIGHTHSATLVRRGGSFWEMYAEYVVVGTIGYADGSEPPVARDIVLKLVDHWYTNRTAVITGTITAEVPLHVQRLINTLKRVTA